MNSYFDDYNTCSMKVKNQIAYINHGLLSLLQSKLTGIYLNGSLVLNAFDEKSSDIDMAVVINKDLLIEEKISIISLLLSISKKPCPLDIVFILNENLLSSQRPPIHLFFNDYWEKQYKQILLDKTKATKLFSYIFSGSDIITDLKLITQSGVCLYGMPINRVFPNISDEIFLDAIISQAVDFYIESDNLSQSSFLVLQLCRILAYKKTGKIYSKPKAAEWALEILPSEYHSIIMAALFIKYGIGSDTSYTAYDALSLKMYVLKA